MRSKLASRLSASIGLVFSVSSITAGVVQGPQLLASKHQGRIGIAGPQPLDALLASDVQRPSSTQQKLDAGLINIARSVGDILHSNTRVFGPIPHAPKRPSRVAAIKRALQKRAEHLVAAKALSHPLRTVGHPVAKVLHQAATKMQTVAQTAAQSRAAYIWRGLACIRHFESHDDYATNTGNGFFGAYQFTYSTWVSVTGLTGLPSNYPPAVQDQAAFKLASSSYGWSPWPMSSVACGL